MKVSYKILATVTASALIGACDGPNSERGVVLDKYATQLRDDMGKKYNTVGMLVDIDGDGMPDRALNFIHPTDTVIYKYINLGDSIHYLNRFKNITVGIINDDPNAVGNAILSVNNRPASDIQQKMR